MRLKDTLHYSGKIVIGSALGKVKTVSSPMNYSSFFDLKMKCRLFSEGNTLLEETLYHLNERGLITFASCKGHGKGSGYVAFILNDDNEDYISKMCGYLLEHTKARIAINPHHYNVEGISVSIYFSNEDRKNVLSTVVDNSLYENLKPSQIVLELIKLSKYQQLIHSDMTFGLYLEKRNQGYYVETEPKFLMHSLDRNISINGLETICAYLDELADFIDEKVINSNMLFKELERINKMISSVIENDERGLKDYYPMFNETELLKFISLYELEPNKLKNIIDKIFLERLTDEEEDYYCRVSDDDSLYFLILKLEESLKVKRDMITLQEEKRVL